MAVTETNLYGKSYWGTGVDMKRSAGNNQVHKLAFLRLIVAQLKNQNPLDPMDNTQFLTQLAQFNTLEQMQNMSRDSGFRYALGLVGRRVTVLVPGSENGEFTVIAAGVRSGDNGEPLLKLAGLDGSVTEVPLDRVKDVVGDGSPQLSDIARTLNEILRIQQLMLYSQQSQAGAPAV